MQQTQANRKLWSATIGLGLLRAAPGPRCGWVALSVTGVVGWAIPGSIASAHLPLQARRWAVTGRQPSRLEYRCHSQFPAWRKYPRQACPGAGPVAVHRRGQGRPSARDLDLEQVLRRGRRLPPSRTTSRHRHGSGVRRVEGVDTRPAPRCRWDRHGPAPRPRLGRVDERDLPPVAPHLSDPTP